MRYRILILFLYLLSSFVVKAQNQLMIDSLKVQILNCDDDIEKAELLLDLARVYWGTDFQKASQHSQEAIELLEDKDPVESYAKAYRYKGNTYLFSGNYDKSLENLFTALKISKELGNNFEAFATAISIGLVYDRLENFEESMQYYYEALGLYNNSKGTKYEDLIETGIMSLYNNIGNNYLSNNEPAKAEEYYQKGLQIAEQEKDFPNIGAIANNLAKIRNAEDDSISAIDYFNRSENARLKINDRSGLSRTYYTLGEFYLFRNDFQKAIEFGKKSYDLGIEVGALLTQKTAAQVLTDAYERTGDYENAFKYQKIFKSVSDSIVNENTISEVARLKFLNEQAIIDAQLLQEKQKTQFKNTLIISILIIVLLIVLSLLLIAKSRQRRTQLEKKEIENNMLHKKKELATNVLYLLRKNETLESVTDKLSELKEKAVDSNKDAVHRIMMELQTEIDDNSWKEFELRFQDVHQEFYEKLQNSFPDLTPSERKLAAFLKLNMSSKEISVITGQSIRSLEVARYRLRKKLGITNKDINLINFLSEL